MITQHINDYLINIKKANLEAPKKELFKILLVRLFGADKKANQIIDQISLGAEKTIFNIPLASRVKTGKADTQYSKVIIEFENDLQKTGEHAKEQLAEYVSGNWKSGEEYNFTLISTDCITWKIFAPDYENLMGNKKTFKASDIKLKEVSKFILNKDNSSEFYYFIDQYLFKTEKLNATLNSITENFGDTSDTFLTCIGIMKNNFYDLENNSELQSCYEQWHRFLSVAYGKFEASSEVFLVHTYLSIFSKILAYEILTKDDYIGNEELVGILKGDIFNKLNIQNFIEDDFYHWVAIDENYEKLKPVFRKIAQKISEFDFTNVKEDILKGVYQELIDIETRHSLGEYYTPDWLCEKTIDELEFKRNSKILDPSCGSGSFLRASIAKLKKLYSDITAEEITDNIIGIDIHPLSVQISKTTILLSIANKISDAKKFVSLRVYLANSLLTPSDSAELFENTFKVTIDNKKYKVDASIFDTTGHFDKVITKCNEIADFYKNKPVFSADKFEELLNKADLINGFSPVQIYSFYQIYLGFKLAKEAERDNIWKFILQNLYKPFMFKERFDFVIGNPPWLTYADMTNEQYQEELKDLAHKYNLLPSAKANMPHLEIAAIFLAHSTSYFLRTGGKIAFVLPRSFLSADHHDNTRNGKASGFKLTNIWDLKDVSTLFRIPSCVLFADKSEEGSKNRATISAGLKGMLVSGKIKQHNASWQQVKNNVKFTATNWFYSKMGKRSAFTNNEVTKTTKTNYYKSKFKQGATIVPRNFYFVDCEQQMHADLEDRIYQFKTSENILTDAKMPWKKFILSGPIDTKFLYNTALAKNVLPFIFINSPIVALPMLLHKNEDDLKFTQLYNSDELMLEGFSAPAKWFQKAEQIWDRNKTEKCKNIILTQWLNWKNKLTDQDFNKQHIVLYTASAKDANACVISRNEFNLEFIVESTTYCFFTNDKYEAHFICTYLNSAYANEKIKDFQARGLFGARHVHKKILELPFPKYNAKDAKHKLLANLGETCSVNTKKEFGSHLEANLSPSQLGKLRLEIRKYLKEEITAIDTLVKHLSES